MKRKLTVVLLIVALLLSVSVQIAAAGNDDGMVTVKQFVVSNMPEPKAVHYFNKVIDMGNGLKGEMLIGKGKKTYLDVWKPNSGKRDLYVWNGSQWVYLHSITDIVPGFEKPMTLNTYKYATWDEYTHTVPTDDNPTPNPNPPSSGLTVSLSGPAKLSVSQKGKYTATVRGGTPPYTLTWSSNGYVSSENYDAYYRWSKEGKYTVTVAVRDLNGQTATASMDVQVVDWKVIVEAPVNSTWYFDGYNEHGGNAAGKIYSDPENAEYGVEVVDGNDVSDFEVEDIAVYNSNNTIHIDVNKFKKKGTGDVTAEWLMGLSDIVENKIQFPIGDVTIHVKVKQISTNRVKEASKKIHIGFAVPVNPNISVEWINHTKPLRIQWYTYTLVTIVKEMMYFKKVTSDTYYGSDEALKKAYDGGDKSLEGQMVGFNMDPEKNYDAKTGTSGVINSDNCTCKIYSCICPINKNTAVNINGDFNKNLTGHLTVINSDGTTKPAVTTSSAGAVAISKKIKGDFNNRDNKINATFSSDGTIEQGMSIVSVDPYPIVVFTNPESSLHDGNFIDITKDVEIKVQLYKGFTAVVKDRYGNKYSVDFKLDQSKPPQSLFPDVPGKPFMVTALVKYINGTTQLPVFTKQDNGNHSNDTVTVYTTSDQAVNDVTGISNHSYSYVEDKDSSKIIGITSDPSSVNLTDLKIYKTTVLYYEKSGIKITPTGEQNGVVKDSHGDIIAAYFRNNLFLYVVPIKKGSGVIHLTKDDLGGPYGIDVPINVNVDAPPFSISVNGTDWDSLDNFGWLIPEPVNNDDQGSGINSEDNTGDTNNTYYCYGVWGNMRKRLDRIGQRGKFWSNLRPYNLDVSTSTSNGIYIRVTVKYGDSPALVVITPPKSSKDVNMTSSMDWINSNLDAVASGNTQEVVQSANYVIDISFNGSDWFTLKQGTDVIHFERDSDIGG